MTIKLEETESQGMILSIQGDLDASNYQTVIDTAKEAVDAGANYLLIDMSEMPFMSSSGLIALHSTALLMRGETPPDPEYGWAALHAIDRDRDSGLQEKVKLLSPQPRIKRTLNTTGMDRFFEIHTDLAAAIASFK